MKNEGGSKMKRTLVYNLATDNLRKVHRDLSKQKGEVTKFKVLPHSLIVEVE